MERIPVLEIMWMLALTALLVSTKCSADSHDIIDSGKPIYQTNWLLPDFLAKTHPGLVEKRQRTMEEEEEWLRFQMQLRDERRMLTAGFWFVIIGIPLMIGSFTMSTVLAQYGGQLIAHLMFPFGLTATLSGAVFRKWMQAEWAIGIGVVVMLGYGIWSHYFKDKGVHTDHVKALLRRNKQTDVQLDTSVPGEQPTPGGDSEIGEV